MIGKNNLTPLTKGGARTVHAGKGSKAAPMAARAAVTQPPGTMPPTMNNYAKATPMANPAPQGVMPGMSSGSFPGTP